MLATAYVSIQPSAEYTGYQPVSGIHRRAQMRDQGPLPTFAAVGTGGLSTENYFLMRQGGYPVIVLIRSSEQPATKAQAPFASLMEEIKAGFGRTMNRLPEVFGVSRQTLYNWLAGKTPKDHHHAKLQQLAAAARVFRNNGMKPTSAMLDKTVAQGKSLLQTVSDGGNGEDTANRLLRILKRGSDSRTKLDAIIGNRKAGPLQVTDMGAPHMDEKS